ncbi:MAG: HAD hydrolase-like protein [Bdellovibrionota bacterium]
MDQLLLAFDLDGTLIDSAQDICNAVNKTVAHFNKPLFPDELIVAHIGEGLRKLLADLFPEAKENPAKADLLESVFLHHYEAEMLKTTTVYPGVEDFLTGFKGSIAIITNKNAGPAREVVSHLKLNRFPWVHIFGADSLAEKKPSPLPLQTVIASANAKLENSFMIGDGTPDMVSAKRAGVKSIAISFGYTQLEVLNRHNPWAVLNRYSDLHSLISNTEIRS